MKELIGRGRLLLVLALFIIILMSYMNGVVPFLIRQAIDKGIVAKNMSASIHYGLLIIGATLGAGILSFIGRYLLTKLAQETIYDLRVKAFDSIQRQSMEYFDNTLVGQLISRVTNDTERVSVFISFRLRMLIYSLFLIGVSLYYMYYMSSDLMAISLLAIVIVALLNTKFGMTIRPLYDKVRHQTGVLAGIATSAIAGIKTVKSLAVENQLMSKFIQENRNFYNYSLNASKLTALYGNLPFLVSGAAMTGILYYGGQLIVAGTLTVGSLVAFLTYMLTLTWPLVALGFSIGDIQRTVAASKRIFEIIDAEPRVKDKPNAITLENVNGELVFENVSFTYPSGTKALRNVSFKVKPGEKIVIMGPPGSGKSTLLKLVLRLYNLDNGRILLDGHDIRDIKLSSLRKHIGYVAQEPFIFNRTIWENIAFGNPDVNMKDIVKAAKTAKIHDFIETLPQGYNTLVGERGVTLSGGQRQRIAIARALVGDPKILLLDDPVSNLDADTEKQIVEDLKEILKDKTALIVTQRPSLVKLADRIIVFKDGEIVEEGTHEELIEKKGHYYKLYTAMLGEHQ